MDTPGPARKPDETECELPREFDEYRLIRPLGQGAGGLVFLAQDTLLDRAVSVKFLRALDQGSLSRFLVEARAAARVQHPNVATLYRVGHVKSRPYLVSEFVRGQSLDRLEKPLPWQQVLQFARDLTSGLGAAHRCGVLHRDLKPANAVLTETGSVKLLDFGLAKLVDADGAPPVPLPRSEAAPPAATAAAGEELEATWVREPELTFRGAIIGTPYYMSPEAWRGDGATTRSDLYSLGALLYELCAGRAPHRGASPSDLQRVVLTEDAAPLSRVAPHTHPAFAAIVDRCLQRDPADRFSSADELLTVLQQFAPEEGKPRRVPQGNPYRGLQPFEAEHRGVFFGREQEVTTIVERLRTEAFLVLTGDSGVGKSSLCLAGVLPKLEESGLEDGRRWVVARMVPGRSPVAALARCLAAALDCPDESLELLTRAQPEALARHVRALLGAGRGLVVYVDQLEELVTLSSPEGAGSVGRALEGFAAGISGLRLVATARSDFLSRLAEVPGLGAHLPRALLLVRSLSPEALREAITGPARLKGGRFESEAFVDTLVRSAGSHSALPLLQFALAELWDARDPRTGMISAMTLESIGGVGGALARHAEGVLASLVPDERKAARAVLLRLVTAEGTRARRSEHELVGADPAASRALEVLVRGRLLVAHESDAGTVYELAHEALLTRCATLAGWLAEAEETRALRQRLDVAALEWERLNCAREALWGRQQLQEAAALDEAELAPRERRFIVASRRAVRRRARVRALTGATFLAALVISYAAATRARELERGREVRHHVTEAKSALERARALDREYEALRGQALAKFDASDPAAEAVWKAALAVVDRIDGALATGEDHLERASIVAPEDVGLRRELAALLFERAALAERAQRAHVAELLVRRMRVFDADGLQARRWSEPATVRLDIQPRGARVELERYERGIDDRLRLVPTGESWAAPVTAKIAPGSYVLRIGAEGRAPVRYPLLTRRGEKLAIALTLPRPADVPAGFVYVPAGRFLYGSGEDDTIRQFFNSAPLHEVTTGPFLIARTETTFAEWIRFLESLPPGERQRRTPRSSATGLHGHLELVAARAVGSEVRSASGWQLRLQPTHKVYGAGDGERVRFANRTAREEQDWRRFPVSGISFDDAKAYARWLADSGRVPGARLCTEVEWERAARGADARIFPHGHRLEPEDANFDQTYRKDPLAFGPDEVGSHPASRSPFEVDDLAGNVWEWVTGAAAVDQAVARGGSFYFASSTCRVNNRETPERTLRDLGVGLRVCATPSF